MCRQGLYYFIYLFLRIGLLIVMKGDQLHLHAWPVAAAASRTAAAFPWIPCLWMNGQVGHQLGFSPRAPSIIYCSVNRQQEFRKINQGSVMRTSLCAYSKVGYDHGLIKVATKRLATGATGGAGSTGRAPSSHCCGACAGLGYGIV